MCWSGGMAAAGGGERRRATAKAEDVQHSFTHSHSTGVTQLMISSLEAMLASACAADIDAAMLTGTSAAAPLPSAASASAAAAFTSLTHSLYRRQQRITRSVLPRSELRFVTRISFLHSSRHVSLQQQQQQRRQASSEQSDAAQQRRCCRHSPQPAADS